MLLTLVLAPAVPGEEGKNHGGAPATAPVKKDAGVGNEERDAFVTTEVDRTSPYVGEQLIFRLKFFYRIGVTNTSLEDLTYGGVPARDLKEFTYHSVVNGVRYQVTEVSKLLIPNESGDITIPGAVLRCELSTGRKQEIGNSLFGADLLSDFGLQKTESRVLRSRPITIHVRTLPPKGKPATFSGLVGSFTLSAELDKKEIQAGESVTLAMTVTGKGDLSFASRPAIQGLEQFKTYDDNPVTSEKIRDDKLISVKVFKTALVALKTGDLTIPEVSIGFFDPESGTYRTASTAPHKLELHVVPGSAQDISSVIAGEAPSVSKQPEQIAGRDIFPIDTDSYLLKDETLHLLTVPSFIALVIPPLLYFAMLALRRKNVNVSIGLGLTRSATALKQAKIGIKEAEILAAEKDPRPCYALLAKTLNTYVGSKLHLACEAKTADELKLSIQQRISEGPLVEQTASLLNKLEHRRFAPPVPGHEKPRSLVQETQSLIEQMERVL